MSSAARKSLLIALLGTLFAALVHLLNAELSGLPSGLHQTADDPSYLRPAENFADHGTWKDNTTGASSYVQRPPLFGAVHLIFYTIFGSKGLVAGMIFGFLLHAFAIYSLPGILSRLGFEKQRYAAALIYALLPCFWGFLSYSITESIAASLIILTISVFTRADNYKTGLSVLMLALIWLLRPVLIIVVIFAFIYQLKRRRFQLTALNFLLTGSAIVLVFCREIRKADYMGSWPELHPIYHETNETMFRPVHKDLSELFRIWETRPEDFHALTGYYWSSERAQNDPVAKAYYKSHSIPMTFSAFDALLRSYSHAENEIKKEFGKRDLKESAEEKKLSMNLSAITSAAIAKNRWKYYVRTPARSAMEMLGKSQLNLELFQLHFRDSLAVKALKIICVTLIISGFLCCLILLLKGNSMLRLLALGTLLYLFYLFWFQRMNEERYMIPVLPIFLIALTGMSNRIIRSARSKLRFRINNH